MIKRIVHLSLIFTFLLTQAAFSQNIIDAELNATPLSVNPAFTGMFNGAIRVGSIYSNYWASVTVPYITYGGSFDMPVVTDNKGNYLAAGFLFRDDKAGDGNLDNFSSSISLAYHKLFGRPHDSSDHHYYDIAIGLQTGYNQNSIDLYPVYFGKQGNNGAFIAGIGQPYSLGLGNAVSYYSANVGFCLAHGGGKFSYTLGAAINNINAPNESIEKKASWTGLLDLYYTGEASADWTVTKRLTLRPEMFYQSMANTIGTIAGNEFRYNVSKEACCYKPTILFIGGWYHTGQEVMLSAGVELKRFRIGLEYSLNADVNISSNGNGQLAISLIYIAPGHKSTGSNRARANF